jgi:hypothetical protein
LHSQISVREWLAGGDRDIETALDLIDQASERR